MQPLPIKTAIVTGPTGSIGIALCSRLLADGIRVIAVTRPDSPRAANLPNHVSLHKVACDTADYACLPSLVGTGADAFFHLAWIGTTGAARNDMPVQIKNIRASVEAARAAAALGCSVFVGVGSQAEYGRTEGCLRPDTPAFPETGYGMAKLCAGQMTRVECARLGLRHVWARVLSVYGPHDGPRSVISMTIRSLLKGQCPALTEGGQLWDYLYSADAAEAIACMARAGRDGAVYPLGSGQAKPLRTYLEVLRDAIDPTLPLGFGQVPYSSGQVMHLEADLTPLRTDTGFVPQTDFVTGIRKTIQWIKEEENYG